MKNLNFKNQVLQGIPDTLPAAKKIDSIVNHAPKRNHHLNPNEKKLAVQNALRYFSESMQKKLQKEFEEELETFGHIYMYRFRPDYEIYARAISQYPHRSKQAAAIMGMLQNNLDPKVAQHPHELITYGGNGAVFQNWAQYLLCMQYLATMTDEQTLVLYSGHPLGLFPSNESSPRVVITNGMMIPNYSKPEHLEKFSALGVTQYGQMTAGSFMYIGSQGIVHGTTITLLNAGRKWCAGNLAGKLFVSSGLGGMSGAQGKASTISGAIGVIAEVNPKAIEKRFAQGWVDEVYENLEELAKRIERARVEKVGIALAYAGNIVDLLEYFVQKKIKVEIGSDQTSLHNPYGGGYYPVGLSYEAGVQLLKENPEKFKNEVQKSLLRHAVAVNELSSKGMYFFDYGNAFLLEVKRAGGDILNPDGTFKYPSYVQDIMGPLCFDYGFGPFRWVCTSQNKEDLLKTDAIAAKVIEKVLKEAPKEITSQLNDNLQWIQDANKNNLVVGSQARILYADATLRIEIARAFNKAIKNKKISAPIVLGRDHHDVSGTDSPYRETSNIYDGSQFTADMAVQNFVGDAMRGATWVSLHNGGGVGFGEVINGGFGLVIDGSPESEQKIKNMLFWDVVNGLSRRSWARNPHAIKTIERLSRFYPNLKVTMPQN